MIQSSLFLNVIILVPVYRMNLTNGPYTWAFSVPSTEVYHTTSVTPTQLFCTCTDLHFTCDGILFFYSHFMLFFYFLSSSIALYTNCTAYHLRGSCVISRGIQRNLPMLFCKIVKLCEVTPCQSNTHRFLCSKSCLKVDSGITVLNLLNKACVLCCVTKLNRYMRC